MSEDKKIPIPLANWLKAGEEGRLIISKEDSKLAHRQFNLTLRPKQIMRAFKECLKLEEYDDATEEELLKLYKVLVNYMLNRNPKLVEAMYRHFKGRLEAYYRERERSRR